MDRTKHAAIAVSLCVAHLSAADVGEITGTVKTPVQPLSDAVVYVETFEGKTFAAPQEPVVLDQVKLTFVPHVLPVLVGTTVHFPNNDLVLHNVFSPRKDVKVDLGTYRPGLARTIRCERPGVIPILCRIHPEMSAFIVAVPTPHYAVTQEKGVYRIPGVPPGRYRLAVWHEAAGRKFQDIVVPERGAVSVDFLMKR